MCWQSRALPNKDEKAPLGHRLVEGSVVEVAAGYFAVELDVEIELQSQSGSPFISQKTGGVVGTLGSARRRGEKWQLLLTPSKSLRAAVDHAKDQPPLREVIGKPKGK